MNSTNDQTTQQSTVKQTAQHTDSAGFYWFDPAVAQIDPSDSQSKWVCSVRSPIGDGVICWAEGETPTECRDRCRTIVASLNGHRELIEAAKDFIASMQLNSGSSHPFSMFESAISLAEGCPW
jgi:hypothetical protein